jgi:hypothetical protein
MSNATISSRLKALNGKRVIKRTSGVTPADVQPMQREQVLKILKERNIPEDKLLEDYLQFSIRGGNDYWLKLKYKKSAYGQLTVSGDEFTFVAEDTGYKTEDELEWIAPYTDEIKIDGIYKLESGLIRIVSFELAE